MEEGELTVADIERMIEDIELLKETILELADNAEEIDSLYAFVGGLARAQHIIRTHRDTPVTVEEVAEKHSQPASAVPPQPSAQLLSLDLSKIMPKP